MRDQVVQCAALKSGQWRDMEELEARAQRGAIRLYRLPNGRVFGVVVDDQHFKVRVVEIGQGIKGLFDHLWRLVVTRHVNRDFRSVGIIAFDG